MTKPLNSAEFYFINHKIFITDIERDLVRNLGRRLIPESRIPGADLITGCQMPVAASTIVGMNSTQGSRLKARN